ncbi:MAG: ABC transporter permease subunit [Clostridia bacterium]|nr:ABC transporter permease subunit [Clostridia bacterium]
MTAIIKRELVAFFKNPIGWFVLAIYAFLSAILFTLFVIWQNTSYLGDYFGFWLFFVDMVVVGILSMRFFSEEKKNKTDQLLLTSPISLYQLVLGKFFGALIIFLLCTSINLFYVLIIDIFGTVDYGCLATNLIGTVLALCAIISIGLFVSALTESSVAAAAGTMAILFFMFVVDFFAMFMPSWLANIIMHANIYAQFDDFTNGILNLPPIVYYISVTVIFLFLAVRMIEKRRWS